MTESIECGCWRLSTELVRRLKQSVHVLRIDISGTAAATRMWTTAWMTTFGDGMDSDGDGVDYDGDSADDDEDGMDHDNDDDDGVGADVPLSPEVAPAENPAVADAEVDDVLFPSS
eukprot:5466508-Pleurochrysis_carterae.AAC.3